MSACTCDEARIEVHAGDHDELDERGRNGGGVDDDGDQGGGIIPGAALVPYWTRSSLVVGGTSPRSTFWDWRSTFPRGFHGSNDESMSETGHVTVSAGRGAVSSSIRGGPVTDTTASVFLGSCMMGFVDMSCL
jgi:hypothetical protein